MGRDLSAPTTTGTRRSDPSGRTNDNKPGPEHPVVEMAPAPTPQTRSSRWKVGGTQPSHHGKGTPGPYVPYSPTYHALAPHITRITTSREAAKRKCFLF